jgi:hypothetical protein
LIILATPDKSVAAALATFGVQLVDKSEYHVRIFGPFDDDSFLTAHRFNRRF